MGFSSGLDEQGIPAQQQALNVVRKFMQTLKFITFLFLVSTRIFGQTISDSETKNVFKSFVKDKRQVFLLPSIDSYYIKELNQYLSSNSFHRTITYTKTGKTISDTLYLSKTERLYVDSCIQSLASFQWTDFEKNKVGLENFSLIKNDQPKKLPNFDYIVYTIVKPIFIRQNSICFLFYDYGCGSLCGHGELIILTKQDNNWLEWWTIFQSNS